MAKMMAKRQQRSLFSTTKLYSDTQYSTFPPELHDGPKLPNGWEAVANHPRLLHFGSET